MSKYEHRPGVHEAFLVKRNLKLSCMPTEALEDVRGRLLQLRGMDEVRAEPERGRLHLTYDASVLHLDRVKAALEEAGCRLDQGRWSRFRQNWYRAADTNVATNASDKPWSCH
jgi:copper chaperone CopZ